ATTANGQGSASGKTFNKGVTLVKYSYALDTTLSCSFTVTVNAQDTLPAYNLQVLVSPNPSAGAFTIQLQSDNNQEKIDLKLFDQFGVVVAEYKGRTAGETITYGAGLRQGTYWLQATQGTTRKTVQLLKL